MNWECMYAPKLEGWVVEAVGSDGEIYVTQFYGPKAEDRAKEYASWKNAEVSAQPRRRSA
jgi:hypothetical protein